MSPAHAWAMLYCACMRLCVCLQRNGFDGVAPEGLVPGTK
uniref:Uncharacterized protein n=1 Tax=Burkholderia sp. B8(2020) TaxID=2713619 RepID=A0A6G6CWW5_9BURK|nr:hypothetical protein [Burkholderia sp. B8(2020)]